MGKQGLGLAVGYATSLLGSVLSLVLYARVLGPVDYGRLAVDLAIVEMIQSVVFQWQRLAVVRFWAANEATDSASYLTTYHLTWLGIACVLIVVSGVGQLLLGKAFDMEWAVVLAMGIGKSAGLYAQELARAVGASVRYAIGGLCLTIGSAVAGIAAFRLTHSLTLILVASTVVFVASGLLCGCRVGIPLGGGRFRKEHFRAMLQYGLPLIPVFLATTALTRIDRPLLAHFASPSVVGVYAASSALISNLIGAICLLVVTPAFPWLLRERSNRSDADYVRLQAKVGVLMLSGVLAVAIGVYCARAEVLPLLLGDAIGHAAQPYVFALLAIAIVGTFRAQFFDLAYHVFAKTRALMTLNLATLVIAVVSLYVGARSDGLNGLLLGLLVANSLSLLLSATFSRTFVDLRHLASRVTLLVVLAIAAAFAGDVVLGGWLTAAGLDARLSGVLAAVAAMIVFACGSYSTVGGSVHMMLGKRQA